MKRDFVWRCWKWLQEFATRGLREAWMSKHYHDRACNNCNVWLSETYGVESVKESADCWTQFTICRNCGAESEWDMRHMLPIYVRHTPKDPTTKPASRAGESND